MKKTHDLYDVYLVFLDKGTSCERLIIVDETFFQCFALSLGYHAIITNKKEKKNHFLTCELIQVSHL